MLISPGDIVITEVRDTSSGLEVTFFVRSTSTSVVSAQSIAVAVEVSSNH